MPQHQRTLRGYRLIENHIAAHLQLDDSPLEIEIIEDEGSLSHTYEQASTRFSWGMDIWFQEKKIYAWCRLAMVRGDCVVELEVSSSLKGTWKVNFLDTSEGTISSDELRTFAAAHGVLISEGERDFQSKKIAESTALALIDRMIERATVRL